MTLPTYIEFITRYPAFGVIPYTQADIEDKLEEVRGLFPQIEGCLPSDNHLLASYYAVRYLFEVEDCESPVPVKSVSSRNDQIVYALAGDGNILTNTTWGSKLNRLFKIYGCFHRSAGLSGGCGCG
jgi:hypothetical protein